MSGQIIGLQDWFATPPGRYLLAWEQAQFDEAVADVFGYHALQLGAAEIEGLRANRMPHRWLALSDPLQQPGRAALFTDFAALPFAANSLDLVVLPHALELSPDPHATLREVERVLVPEGRVVICGLNPASLWGMRQRRKIGEQRGPAGLLQGVAQGQPAVRHAVGAQSVDPGGAELQGVIPEDVRHRLVELGLLPRQQVAARGSREPILQTYNLTAHDPCSAARLR